MTDRKGVEGCDLLSTSVQCSSFHPFSGQSVMTDDREAQSHRSRGTKGPDRAPGRDEDNGGAGDTSRYLDTG